MGHDGMGHGSEVRAAVKHKQLSSQAATPAVWCGACLLVGKITAHVTCHRVDILAAVSPKHVVSGFKLHDSPT